MTQTERINLMEGYLDESAIALKNFEFALKDYQKIQSRLHELADYYSSDEWRRDFNDDNKGVLPLELKREVLSEDAIYNLLSENQKLLAESLEVIASILRSGRF